MTRPNEDLIDTDIWDAAGKYWESEPARKLFAEFPWPETPPAVPPKMHTWFTAANEQMLLTAIPRNARCIVELGSWYGGSALWMAKHFPDALIVCVDIWKPYPEILTRPEWADLQPAAYSHFIANLWPHRHRVIPVRDTTWNGMARARRAGIDADAVYIDADHMEKAVALDVVIAAVKFPRAVLVGDDWNRAEVQRGATLGLALSGFPAKSFITNETCWACRR